jgi:MFS family permease
MVLSGGTDFRLALMFLLQNLVWGAQVVLLAGHMQALGFSGVQMSYVFATGSLAALVSPLAAGWAADRLVAAQVFAGVSYLACAPLLAAAWYQVDFVPLWFLIFAFALLHMPTMALTNAIAFRHLGQARNFGRVRVWGSVGWVSVSWALSLYLYLWEVWQPGENRLGDGLLVSAFLSVAMGVYCFFLPPSPPARGGRKALAFFEAFSLLRLPGFAVIIGGAFVVAVLSPFFYNFAFLFLTDPNAGAGLGAADANLALSLGQLVEIPLLLGLSGVLRRLGLKGTLILGVGAQAARALILAAGGPLWLVVAGQALNGFFVICFIVAVSIAVETLCRPELRASAQALLVLCVRGAGPLVGQILAGRAYDFFVMQDGSRQWGWIFLLPGSVGVAMALVFALALRGRDLERL